MPPPPSYTEGRPRLEQTIETKMKMKASDEKRAPRRKLHLLSLFTLSEPFFLSWASTRADGTRGFCGKNALLRTYWPSSDITLFIASSFFLSDNYCAQSLTRKENLINCLNYSGLSPSLARSSPCGAKRVECLTPQSRNFNIFRLTALDADRHNVPPCYRPDLLAIENFLPRPTDWHGYSVSLKIILRTLLLRNYRKFSAVWSWRAQ